MTAPARDAWAIAAAVRSRATTAVAETEAALERISRRDRELNCFTAIVAERALADAAAVDAAVAAGSDPGPLVGVPFAVKNLFDIEGLTTIAGSRIDAERPPAKRDAFAVAALKGAGAVLVGALNMDEYACGITTENTHYGPTRNPHDLSRIAGGSSGGSAAAVAGGLVPLTLGSDTGGSIRVPAALCGVFGLKPTYGRLSRAGITLFAPSMDHIGPLARSVRDLALAYDAMQGPDPADPACRSRPVEAAAPHLDGSVADLRIAVADGYFSANAEPAALAAVATVAKALKASRRVAIPNADIARAAMSTIVASESGNLHLPNLRRRAQDFDPMTRDRLLAGALLPAAFYLQAQRFRRWYRDQVAEVFREVDVVLAPTTPFAAPKIGQERVTVGGVETLARPALITFTSALSFIGLPVVAAPVRRSGGLPLGVQIVARPWNETAALRVAAALEREGVVAAAVA